MPWTQTGKLLISYAAAAAASHGSDRRTVWPLRARQGVQYLAHDGMKNQQNFSCLYDVSSDDKRIEHLPMTSWAPSGRGLKRRKIEKYPFISEKAETITIATSSYRRLVTTISETDDSLPNSAPEADCIAEVFKSQ